MQKQPQLPLAGVRVIDFGQQIAGPAVAMVLADLGATVIHIDPPQGPQWKHAANAILNRNKSCLRLDLKTDQGLSQALSLIDQADIVIESFRPGVMEKLGVDFQQLRDQRGGEHDGLMLPQQMAETYFHVAHQHRSAWTHELDLRAFSDLAWWNH